jgi:hypothetical protein
VSWEIPSPAAGLARKVFGGWAVDSIGRIRSGMPFSVITQVVDPLNFAGNRRVDYLGGDVWRDDASVPGGRRLNRDALAIPAASAQGTLGRNAIRGFAVRQIDASLRRTFPLGDIFRAEFRGDLFNLTNTPNFGRPNFALAPTADPLFGVSRTTFGRFLGGGGSSGGLNPLYQIGGPRSVQFSLRVIF